jgi:phospholipase/carboxylesterase
MKRVILISIIMLLVYSLTGKGAEEPGSFLEKNLEEYWQKGWTAYQAGEYEQAVDIYLDGLQYDITNGSNIYNLACCYGLLGNARLAARFLSYSIKNGFENYQHIIDDQDFDKVRESVEYKAVVDSLARYLEKKKNPEVQELWFAAEAYAKTYLRLPDNYDPQKSYPLVVGLHGYGGKGSNFISLWQKFKDRDFIYVCPETFYPFNMGKETGYNWYTWAGDEDTDQEIVVKTEEYIEKVTRELKSKYNVDEIYLLGFSQGCGLAYTAGIRYHELFTGLICFGGWLDLERLTDEVISSAIDLEVFIAHGKDDKMVSFEEGKAAEKKLKEMGFKTYFYEFEGGHSVPKEALEAAQKWLEF